MNKEYKTNIPRYIVVTVLLIAVAIMWVNNKNKAELLEKEQNKVTVKMK